MVCLSKKYSIRQINEIIKYYNSKSKIITKRKILNDDANLLNFDKNN